MDKVRILLPILVIAVVIGVIYVSFSKPKPSETTTTILIDNSTLMDKYLNDSKFCINDSDCHFRCGYSVPVACENKYWIANQTGLICTGQIAFSRYRLPACLCNITIRKCYINYASTSEDVKNQNI